ncbi:hypothetical protein OIU76_011958 [Salix suchowensis]|nr:hypothetical protein OIU76_011958 [Salix suchowensis]KAJ6357198.1 hypothetical protein OIU78_005134 [Salix suchowensis]
MFAYALLILFSLSTFLPYSWQEKAIQVQNNMLVKQIKEKEKKDKAVAQPAPIWDDQQNQGPHASSFLLSQPAGLPLPCLNIGGCYQEEADPEVRRNELDHALEPTYSFHLGGYGA